MHILIIYNKADRSLIAAFETNTLLTEMNVLKTPGVDFLVTLKRDVIYQDKNGKAYVQGEYIN